MTKSQKTPLLLEIESRFRMKMPEVLRQISVYENNVKMGKTMVSPTPAPQFKGKDSDS